MCAAFAQSSPTPGFVWNGAVLLLKSKYIASKDVNPIHMCAVLLKVHAPKSMQHSKDYVGPTCILFTYLVILHESRYFNA